MFSWGCAGPLANPQPLHPRKMRALFLEWHYPPTPTPARLRPGPLQGPELCPHCTGPWAQLLSAGWRGSWCPWGSALSADSPAREPPAPWNEHKAMLGPLDVTQPHKRKSSAWLWARPCGRGTGTLPRGGIRIQELVPQPSGSHALRLLQPPWPQAGPCAVAPAPYSTPLARSH